MPEDLDADGNKVAIETTTDPSAYPMNDAEGNSYIPEEADGVWYFTVPYVAAEDHLVIKVELIAKKSVPTVPVVKPATNPIAEKWFSVVSAPVKKQVVVVIDWLKKLFFR